MCLWSIATLAAQDACIDQTIRSIATMHHVKREYPESWHAYLRRHFLDISRDGCVQKLESMYVFTCDTYETTVSGARHSHATLTSWWSPSRYQIKPIYTNDLYLNNNESKIDSSSLNYIFIMTTSGTHYKSYTTSN